MSGIDKIATLRYVVINATKIARLLMYPAQIKVDKAWFDRRMKEKNLSLRTVAKLMDVDPSALSRVFNGKRRIQVDEIGKIATILNESKSAVLAHIEVGGAPELSATSSALMDDGLRGGPADKASTRGRHPGFGFMKGQIIIQDGFDVTKPFDDEAWDEGYLGTDGRK
ncbi:MULTISPECIES: helix-turn-helix domain-containing protein [unclassified Mesorhizobium]|uniref:helix-turn-helix domain-containing protein n=1 Tax=unclassified Mesorhizobium TaxID=325217 RepID=UPI0030154140